MRTRSIWPAPPPWPSRRPLRKRIASAFRALRALFWAFVFLAGIPAGLVVFVGWPLPRHLPSGRELLEFAARRDMLTTQMLIDAVAILIWLVWGTTVAFVIYLLAGEARRRVPRIPVPGLRRLVTGLVGSITVTTTAHTAVAPPPAVAAPADTAADRHPLDRAALDAEPTAADERVADERSTDPVVRHRVVRGDTLWGIAEDQLGDGTRWDDIYDLNAGRRQPDGKRLRDPDLIHPGWTLTLPGQRAAEPQPSPRPAVPDSDTASPSDDETAAELNDPPPPGPAGTPAGPPTVSADPAGDEAPRVTAEADQDGLLLSDGSWLPWTLASGLAAAAAMVWLHRRRRYTGEPDDDPPFMPPPAIAAVQRQLDRRATSPADIVEPVRVGDVPLRVADASLPGGVVCLSGEGAHAAARAAIVATLASGDPDHPEQRGQVITDHATLSMLLGSAAGTMSGWHRLHIAADVYEALAALDAQLLHRARILDENAVTDIDTLLQQAPDQQALPPILLVAGTVAPAARLRAKTSLDLAASLWVNAVILDPWPGEPTMEIAADGTVWAVDGPARDGSSRLAVLAPEAMIEALSTLREAHTGQPAMTPRQEAVPIVAHRTALPSVTDTRAVGGDADPASAAAAKGRKARLRVLGRPGIDDVTAPGRPLRAKALELGVLLACHPDGLTTNDIGAELEPDVKVKPAKTRVHTNVSNLRHVIARAAGERPNAYVVKRAGRYILDPDTVEVDLWTFRDLLRTAGSADGQERRRLLQAACDLYTAPLAQGQTYEWFQPHREAVRRWGTEAHLRLAAELLPGDPGAAVEVLDKAIALDRYNERLYQQAMHARHALGDPDAVRRLLHTLARNLADVDAEPSEDTQALAHELGPDTDQPPNGSRP